MIEKTVLQEEYPDTYEIKAIKNFESKKKNEDEFASLDLLK
jgi:hypothetical protein